MTTYQQTSRNKLDVPAGLNGEKPDVVGDLLKLAQELDDRLGAGGAEPVANWTAVQAIPTTRSFAGKKATTADLPVTYRFDGTNWYIDGSRHILTAAQRAALPTEALRPELIVAESDTGLEWIYLASRWVRYPIVDSSEAVGAFAATSGWTIDGQFATKMGPLASVGVTYHRSGGSVTIPANGSLSGITVATFRPGWLPVASAGLPTGGSGPLESNYVRVGTGLQLNQVYPYSTSIANGDTFSAAGLYLLSGS